MGKLSAGLEYLIKRQVVQPKGHDAGPAPEKGAVPAPSVKGDRVIEHGGARVIIIHRRRRDWGR